MAGAARRLCRGAAAPRARRGPLSSLRFVACPKVSARASSLNFNLEYSCVPINFLGLRWLYLGIGILLFLVLVGAHVNDIVVEVVAVLATVDICKLSFAPLRLQCSSLRIS